MSTTHSSPRDIVVRLPADCRLDAVEALASALADALNGGAVVLDGREVQRIDNAVLQLLLVFQREANSRAVAWCWQDLSEPLIEAATALGMAEALTICPTAPEPD